MSLDGYEFGICAGLVAVQRAAVSLCKISLAAR